MLVNHYHCIGVALAFFRWLSMFFMFVFSRGQFLEERFLKERRNCFLVFLALFILGVAHFGCFGLLVLVLSFHACLS